MLMSDKTRYRELSPCNYLLKAACASMYPCSAAWRNQLTASTSFLTDVIAICIHHTEVILCLGMSRVSGRLIETSETPCP